MPDRDQLGRGLQGGKDRFGGIRVFAREFAQETADRGQVFAGLLEFDDRGDGSVGGVLLDHVDDLRGVFGVLHGLWKVEASDLEAVEKETGAAGVNGIVRDTAEDLPDGELDGAAIFRQRQIEGVLASTAGIELTFWDGLSGGVVVVAKIFSAEAWAAATVTLDVDVAALKALGLLGLLRHRHGPPRTG